MRTVGAGFRIRRSLTDTGPYLAKKGSQNDMKIIHTGDVHLGAEPDAEFPWAAERKEHIRRTFQKIIEICKNEKTDLLLIAGDLFHRPPTLRELREVNYLFQTIPDTTVVLVAGNHDHLKKNGVYETFSWNSNVIGLWERECEMIPIPKLDLAVYGCSYYGQENQHALYDALRPAGGMRYHILLAHGGDAKHLPFNRDKLAHAGFDYVALGHIHKPQVLLENRMLYCGAPEPIDCNDFGPHGYVRAQLDEHGITAEFVPLATCSYRVLQVEVDADTSQLALEDWIKKKIEVMGADDIYHLKLTGIRQDDFEFDHVGLQKLGRIVRIDDQTCPDYDLEALEQIYEGSLTGAFIQRLKDKGELEKKALYYGLEALLKARGKE